ncbi:MAG: type IV pilin protein [Ignavibacteria bacterium]
MKGNRAAAPRMGGFTLIELLVVIVIIGLLVGVAWPSYQESVRKGHRADAQAFLMDLAQQEQRYFLDARSYAPDLATLNASAPASVSAYYATPTFTVTAGTPPTFSISIAPTGGQAGDSCGTLTIDSSGNKTSSSGSNCW